MREKEGTLIFEHFKKTCGSRSSPAAGRSHMRRCLAPPSGAMPAATTYRHPDPPLKSPNQREPEKKKIVSAPTGEPAHWVGAVLSVPDRPVFLRLEGSALPPDSLVILGYLFMPSFPDLEYGHVIHGSKAGSPFRCKPVRNGTEGCHAKSACYARG